MEKLNRSSINTLNVDARLPRDLLTDARLQAYLTGDQFRAYMNLLHWLVKQATDGEFDRRAVVGIVPHVDAAALAAMVEEALIEACGDGRYRLIDFLRWQTSREDLELGVAKRAKATEKKRNQRALAVRPADPLDPVDTVREWQERVHAESEFRGGEDHLSEDGGEDC